MLNHIKAFLFTLAFALGFLPASYVNAGDAIIIDAEDGAGPWGNAKGEGAGNDLVKAAFKAAGMEVTLHIVSYATCKEEVMHGTVVACYAMSTAPLLENFVKFADKPLYTPWAGIYATTNAKPVTTVEELLKGHTIGTVYGYEYPALISNLQQKGFDVTAAANEDVLMRKLDDGKSDFAIFMLDDLKNIDFLLRDVHVTHPPILRMKVPAPGSYVGFSLKHPDGLKVKKIFDTGFNKIINSGEYKKIVDHWKAETAGY